MDDASVHNEVNGRVPPADGASTLAAQRVEGARKEAVALAAIRLTESALAAVLEQTFALVSVAVTDASNTAAVADSSALLGSALLCATLNHRGQQQAAYTKVAALCSARLQELEQTHGTNFYQDERVALKFEQLSKPQPSRPLRQDDDGGIPGGSVMSHSVVCGSDES